MITAQQIKKFERNDSRFSSSRIARPLSPYSAPPLSPYSVPPLHPANPSRVARLISPVISRGLRLLIRAESAPSRESPHFDAPIPAVNPIVSAIVSILSSITFLTRSFLLFSLHRHSSPLAPLPSLLQQDLCTTLGPCSSADTITMTHLCIPNPRLYVRMSVSVAA